MVYNIYTIINKCNTCRHINVINTCTCTHTHTPSQGVGTIGKLNTLCTACIYPQ